MARRSFGSIRKLPSGSWRATYIDQTTGDRVAAPSTFRTKADAALWLSSVEADRARGDLLDPRLSRRPFSEWASEWLDGLHVKPKTRVGYESCLRNHVLPEFGQRPVSTITYRDCKRFVDDLRTRGLAPGTIGEARKVLRLVLREALRADAIRRNPADGIRIPRGERQEMVFLSPEEVFTLADAVANSPRPRNQPLRSYTAYGLLVRFAAFTGLRAGEIAALRIARANPLHRWVEVVQSVEEIHGELVYGPPKTYARRRVELPAGLADELVDHLASRTGDPDDFVFTSPNGGPLRHTNFYGRHFKPAVGRAGIDPSTRFHDLRHTAAALMIAEGAHLLVVKERLGHSTITVTADRYGHLFPSLEAALTAKLDHTYRAASEVHSGLRGAQRDG